MYKYLQTSAFTYNHLFIISIFLINIIKKRYSNLSVTRPISELVTPDKLKEVEEIVDKSLEGKEDKVMNELKNLIKKLKILTTYLFIYL